MAQLPRKEVKVVHPLKPIYNNDSKILILGSFPSVKSREVNFYYGHPGNRFWKVLESVYEENIGSSNIDKTKFLLKHNIALWDVVKSCTIIGSSDSSIKDVTVNDIERIIRNTKIKSIYTTGKKAYDLYQKYIYPKTKIEAIYLPSTSPLNASISLKNIINEYKKLRF